MLFVGTWAVIIGLLVLGLTARFNWPFLQEWWAYILSGAQATILLTVISITFACGLALLGALGRLSGNPVANGLASLYVSVIRGTPLIVQLFIWTYALAEWGLILPLFWCGIVALGVNYGAYMTEVFRAGIESVPRGQTEAGRSVGMSHRQTMARIILPQAIRNMIPAIGNDAIAMLKDSSLASVLAVREITQQARLHVGTSFDADSTYLVLTLLYLTMTLSLSLLLSWYRRRLGLDDRG